jgi:hypothetical protein
MTQNSVTQVTNCADPPTSTPPYFTEVATYMDKYYG